MVGRETRFLTIYNYVIILIAFDLIYPQRYSRVVICSNVKMHNIWQDVN